MDAVATHHLVATSSSNKFIVEVSDLKPYNLLDGNWRVIVLFVEGQINTVGGIAVKSPNSTSPNEKKHFLACFSGQQHYENQYVTIFHPNNVALTGHRISYATDKLYFELKSFDDKEIACGKKMCLGVSLVQYRV